MSFLQLVRREMHGSLPKLLFMSALGGIATAAILAGINAGLQGKSGLWAAMLFRHCALSIYQRPVLRHDNDHRRDRSYHSQNSFAPYGSNKALGNIGNRRQSVARRIVSAITGDTAVLTQASNMLCFTVQGVVLILFVAIYVAFLSLAAIFTSIVIVSIAATIFHLKNRRLVAEKQRSAEWERRLFDRLIDFLDGFKEVRLNNARSDDLFDDAVNVSRTAANIKIKSQAETFKLIVTSQISMYVLLGAVVFVAPQFSGGLGGARPDQDHDGAHVHCRRMFQSCSVDTNLDECQRGRRSDRPTGNYVADNRFFPHDARNSDAEAFRQDRDAQY